MTVARPLRDRCCQGVEDQHEVYHNEHVELWELKPKTRAEPAPEPAAEASTATMTGASV